MTHLFGVVPTQKMGHNVKITGRILLARELEAKCFGNTGKARRIGVNF